MKQLIFLFFLFPNITLAQQYCKYGRSKIYSYQNPIYSEEASLFPTGKILSKGEVQLEANGSFGSDFHPNPDFIRSSFFLARYGIFQNTEIQSGIAFQDGFDTYPTYDFNRRYQYIVKRSLGEWFKTNKHGVPSSISIRYYYQESEMDSSKNNHSLGYSLNHTFYNYNWRINFALIQYYILKGNFIQTISIKAIRKTNNPNISVIVGYRDNYNAKNIIQLGVIYSDLNKYRFAISISKVYLKMYSLNLSYTYRI